MAQPAAELLALGGAIRHLRRERELSQEALAYAAGVHPKHVSEIERANKDPRTTTVVRLADALGVTVAELYELSASEAGKPPT
jgi:transcriptional regulator with XRE-family HTH domain